MIRNYIKIAFRNLIRDRAFSVLNLLGLSIGLASVIMIMAYVRYELSYDKGYNNHTRVYRLLQERKTANIDETMVYTPMGLAQVLQKEYPEVKNFTIGGSSEVQFRYHNEIVSYHIFQGNEQFFKVFNFHFIKGDPNTALAGPGNIVVTKKFAERFLTGKSPVGSIITDTRGNQMQVTGVIENIPANNHFSADAIGLDNNPDTKQQLNPQDFTSMSQYVLLGENANPEKLERKFKSIYKKYNFPKEVTIRLQPVTDIHLRSHYQGETSVNSDIKFVYIFISAGLLILFIACVNYINLATARSLQRAKEIGLRKVMGATKRQLISQFLIESFLFFLLSTILAFLLTIILWPIFSAKVTVYQHELPLFDVKMLMAVFVIFVLGGLLASAYPAFFLSSLQPAKILKGLSKFGVNITLRKALVIIQFVVSGILITSTIIIKQQLNYISNARLGFNKDNLITIPFFMREKNVPAFKDELAKIPGIKAVSLATWRMGSAYGGWKTAKDIKDSTKENRYEFVEGDPDFIKTMQLNIISGRNFSTGHSNDVLNFTELFKKHLPDDESHRFRVAHSIILNQEAVKILDLKNPVGAVLEDGPVNGTVIGVVENFNGLSLHQKIPSVIISCSVDNDLYQMYVRVSPGNTQRTIAGIETQWKKFYPDHRFEFSFTDEKLQKLYTADQRFGALFGTFASLAIIIACLGLFGLVSLTIQNRVKEIGIRKVLGASILNIASLVSSDFTKLVLVSFLVSSPITWYAMNKWLQTFAYRIDIQWWVFAAAGLIAVIISLATLSFQSIKAALANPVNSLRSE